MTVQISASLLSADFSALGASVQALDKAGADRLHFDIMDGHFVPNLTFGPAFLKALRPLSTLLFEAHLMVKPAEPLIESVMASGADLILIHPESVADLPSSLQKIKGYGKKAGVVLNPPTSPDILTHVLEGIDQVLVMTVSPGFGGQAFLAPILEKVQRVRALLGKRPVELAVDGGIVPQTAKQAITAGADVLVAGSFIFQGPSLAENIAALKHCL